ncbi:MAG: UDP-N-acetylmuramoyl-tripeptide--D-alanyl-D-alanine ligase [Candidatus Doudnabacteria bacterium]|nr:UDP-N-acetylmuramoyl-tripeptide--D-alanyl-D-alanine ligase [Candidatus Doudnabacteria bacterium]
MNLFKIPIYQLYLFQLENYELKRYFRLLAKKGLLPPKESLRKSLVWTAKARMIFALAGATYAGLLILAIIFTYQTGLSVLSIKYYVLCITLIPLYFILYTLYSVILWPMDWLAKSIIINQAKSKIKNQKSKITIIGIAGSYGKTTMKEVLRQVLSIKYKVLSTPESVNTPVGIARWILRQIDETAQIIIVEMGEYYQGDIIELCKLMPPDIGILTGINEAHLERMRTPDKIIATIFEIVQGMKEKGLLVLNGDDKNVMKNYYKYVRPGQEREKFQISNFKFQQFNSVNLCWECEHVSLGELKIHLLGEYALGDVDCAIKIGKILGMDNEAIKQGIKKIRPISHRLEPGFSPGNILVIDDAYNGNPDGAREAIKVVSRFEGRRKIYITPGLVEIGSGSREIHLEIGRQLAAVADVVILIRNSVSSFIQEGINESIKYPPSAKISGGRQVSSIKEKKSEIIWFNTAPEAHAALSKILKPNDVILFQNDWGDQYL